MTTVGSYLCYELRGTGRRSGFKGLIVGLGCGVLFCVLLPGDITMKILLTVNFGLFGAVVAIVDATLFYDDDTK